MTPLAHIGAVPVEELLSLLSGTSLLLGLRLVIDREAP